MPRTLVQRLEARSGRPVAADSIPRPSLRRRGLRPTLFLLAAALAASPAAAQQYGQWTWDASVGLGERRFDTERDGSEISESTQQNLDLSLGLNGFVVHPAVAAFTLGVDVLLAQTDQGTTVDSERFGGRAELRLLPQGAFPLQLFYRRESYDYSGSGVDDALTLFGAPDASERWGGRFRAKRGALRGLLLGAERTTIDFLDPAADQEVQDLQFVDWSRGDGKLDNHVKLERRVRDYGTADLEIEDLVLNVDERAQLGPTWRWEIYGTGIWREFTDDTGFDNGTDSYQLRQRFRHDVRQSDLLDVFLTTTRVESDLQSTNDSYGVSAFYRWHPRAGLELAPFVQYSRQTAGDLEIDSPRAGLSATWNRRGDSLDGLMSARVSAGSIERDEPGFSEDETQTAFGFNASLGHGAAPGWREEFEVEWAHDELRLTRDPILELPDLGLAGVGLDSEDYYRARALVSYHADSRSMSAWGEWSLRESTGDLDPSDFETETVSGNAHLAWWRLSVRAYAGETTTMQAALDQEIRFLGATARWRLRYLGLRASYREDERDVELAPDVDADRLEAGFETYLGQLRLEALCFENTERLIGAEERTNRGTRWAVSSRFGGALPIVTGTKRRGVIR